MTEKTDDRKKAQDARQEESSLPVIPKAALPQF
jgi:hypothetical protein